ncbi:MAG TPA: DUF3365 domain-containing protein [Anaeromyxobacteraceae bacterium]|nr:DUF3365 domain-containing protein [Anaeromyxobacteraceae bacterium]
MRRIWSLQGRLHLAAGFVFALAAIAVVLLVNRQQRSAALRVSEYRANAIIERNLAIHAFYAEELRPAVGALAARVPGGVSFDPVWMSSGYAARRIDARVPSSRGIYYYKESTIGARNPDSEADEIERAFLERTRGDPSLDRWVGESAIDGAPWFVLMRRGAIVERSCLECHSRPEVAPAGLVEMYGRSRGFGRREGEVGSVVSVRIPLRAAYAEANAFSLALSAALLAVLAAAYVAQWAVQRRLVYGPLRKLQIGAVQLAARSTRRCEPLPIPPVAELRDVTVAFNAMAESIARHTDELEGRVQERTQQLMAREVQLQHAQRMEAVGRLAGGIAHDFNNLLTAIRGNADLLAEECAGAGGASREEVDEIREAASRASNLTRQLLAFSRRDVPQQRTLRVDEVVAQLARMLERLLPENVKLALDLAAGDAVVKGDSGQLEQVVLNLVVNARDALPDGGDVRVETRLVAHDDPLAAREARGGGPWVRLAVVDEGAGMQPEVLAHAFEPFFTTKPQGQGTGLGLATVYGIVQQHGGHIAVESRVGEGSVFRVYLPVCAAAPVATPTRVEPPVSAKRDEQVVLVVEDEPAVRRLVVSTLRRRGHRVIEADSAEAALRLAANEARLDLLVSDVVMSGEGGHVLAARLRAERRDLRVLLVSGYAPGEELRAQLGASGAAFLPKPFTSEELADRVASLLG